MQSFESHAASFCDLFACRLVVRAVRYIISGAVAAELVLTECKIVLCKTTILP
jgi:hypothetical protein